VRRRVGDPLLGNRGGARQPRAVLLQRAEVARDEDPGAPRHGKRRFGEHAPRSVEGHAERGRNGRSCDTGRPEHRLRRNLLFGRHFRDRDELIGRGLRLRARPVDQEGMMSLLINDCRKDLEEVLDLACYAKGTVLALGGPHIIAGHEGMRIELERA